MTGSGHQSPSKVISEEMQYYSQLAIALLEYEDLIEFVLHLLDEIKKSLDLAINEPNIRLLLTAFIRTFWRDQTERLAPSKR
jgi:hypothetical protein